MQRTEQEKVPLRTSSKQKDQPSFSSDQPPPISNRHRRPWRGIFLSYFLLFCGLLFFTHGIHKYSTFSFWDLLAVWSLSSMLLIPGVYFGLLILLIQLRVKGFTYNRHTQLSF